MNWAFGHRRLPTPAVRDSSSWFALSRAGAGGAGTPSGRTDAHLDSGTACCQIHTESAVRLGLTVIMTVHDPNDAMQYADRVGLVSDGGLIALGTPDEVLTAENLGRLYGMPIEVLTDGNRRVIVAGTPS